MITLNLVNAALVIRGSWNTAIFQDLGWVSTYMMGVEDGEDVEGHLVINVPTQKRIVAINDVGFACTEERLEFFLMEDGEAAIAKLEAVAARTLSTLIHTPVNACGANFSFVVDEEEPGPPMTYEWEMVSKLDKIPMASISEIVWHEGDTRISIKRNFADNQMVYNFNFHIEKFQATGGIQRLEGFVASSKLRAIELLSQLYGIDASDYRAQIIAIQDTE